MEITFDESKRAKTLAERGLDFRDAAIVLSGLVMEVIDDRFDYGEARYQTLGDLNGAIVMLVWTPRDGTHRIISIRMADDDERTLYRRSVGGCG